MYDCKACNCRPPAEGWALDCEARAITYFAFSRWNNSHELRSTQLCSSFSSLRDLDRIELFHSNSHSTPQSI